MSTIHSESFFKPHTIEVTERTDRFTGLNNFSFGGTNADTGGYLYLFRGAEYFFKNDSDFVIQSQSGEYDVNSRLIDTDGVTNSSGNPDNGNVNGLGSSQWKWFIPSDYDKDEVYYCHKTNPGRTGSIRILNTSSYTPVTQSSTDRVGFQRLLGMTPILGSSTGIHGPIDVTGVHEFGIQRAFVDTGFYFNTDETYNPGTGEISVDLDRTVFVMHNSPLQSSKRADEHIQVFRETGSAFIFCTAGNLRHQRSTAAGSNDKRVPLLDVMYFTSISADDTVRYEYPSSKASGTFFISSSTETELYKAFSQFKVEETGSNGAYVNQGARLTTEVHYWSGQNQTVGPSSDWPNWGAVTSVNTSSTQFIMTMSIAQEADKGYWKGLNYDVAERIVRYNGVNSHYDLNPMPQGLRFCYYDLDNKAPSPYSASTWQGHTEFARQATIRFAELTPAEITSVYNNTVGVSFETASIRGSEGYTTRVTGFNIKPQKGYLPTPTGTPPHHTNYALSTGSVAGGCNFALRAIDNKKEQQNISVMPSVIDNGRPEFFHKGKKLFVDYEGYDITAEDWLTKEQVPRGVKFEFRSNDSVGKKPYVASTPLTGSVNILSGSTTLHSIIFTGSYASETDTSTTTYTASTTVEEASAAVVDIINNAAVFAEGGSNYFTAEVDVLNSNGGYQDLDEPAVGLNMMEGIEFLNEWNFKPAWHKSPRQMNPDQYAVCFKEARDAVREVSSKVKIVTGGMIRPNLDQFSSSYDFSARGANYAMLDKLDELYGGRASNPHDYYLAFHWYMRNGSMDQGGDDSTNRGASPEEVGYYPLDTEAPVGNGKNWFAWDYAEGLNDICEDRNLPGWYCTETGWSTEGELQREGWKQSAPSQSKTATTFYTSEESQGLLFLRLTLIWGSFSKFQGVTFFDKRDNYDQASYLFTGVNYDFLLPPEYGNRYGLDSNGSNNKDTTTWELRPLTGDNKSNYDWSQFMVEASRSAYLSDPVASASILDRPEAWKYDFVRANDLTGGDWNKNGPIRAFTPKPSRGILQDFVNQYGDYHIVPGSFETGSIPITGSAEGYARRFNDEVNQFYVTLQSGSHQVRLGWADRQYNATYGLNGLPRQVEVAVQSPAATFRGSTVTIAGLIL